MKTLVRRVGVASVALAASMAVTAYAAGNGADAGGSDDKAAVKAAVNAAVKAAAPAAVQAQPLVQGQGIAITTVDVEGDALRMPENLRAEVLAKPALVQQMASNLYVYRGIAQQAKAQGLDQQPQVAAAMQAAQDKVLADAWLKQLDDKSRPTAAAAEAKARAIYQAEPKKFEAPEQVHARHILISGTDAQARAKAEELLKALKGGADFAELARKESADKGSGARGGDLGFFGRGQMVAPFEQAAFAMRKKGELSGLVESQFGFHIIRFEEHRPAGVLPFEQVRDALVQEVSSGVTQKARADAAAQVRKNGVVDEQAVQAFAQQHSAPAKP